MKSAVMLVCGSLICSGQVSVSFSPQGSAALRALTGKKIPGFQLVQVSICSTSASSTPSGLVYQKANGLGIATLAPGVAKAIVMTTVNKNWRVVSLAIAKYAMLIAAGATASGLVAASAAWKAGTVLGYAMTDNLPGLVQARIPNPDPFLSALIDGESAIAFTGPGCKIGLIAAQYTGKQPAIAPVMLDSPGAVMRSQFEVERPSWEIAMLYRRPLAD